MLIQCTKKLLDRMKVQPQPRIEENPLFSWHANLITMNRRQTVILMNDQSKYVIVLYGLKGKDFSKINEWIRQAIRNVFREEGIWEKIIDDYLHQAGDVVFTKTKDRSSVAKLNRACGDVQFFEDLLDPDSVIQSNISFEVSRTLVGDGKNDYFQPNEKLYQDLHQWTGEEIFSMKAVELKVTLMLDKYHVWRRLIVPLHRTFQQLHDIVQVAFSWQDYHLHEFYICDQTKPGKITSINHPSFTKEGYKPIVNLVCDEEAFAYPVDDVEMRMETGIKLSEYIPKSKVLRYNYDFGDNWRHRMDVLRVIDNYKLNHPVCLAGDGKAPPEDVGGEGGYEEFLRIIENPEDPDFVHMERWVIGQGFEEFDMERMNHMLKEK